MSLVADYSDSDDTSNGQDEVESEAKKDGTAVDILVSKDGLVGNSAVAKGYHPTREQEAGDLASTGNFLIPETGSDSSDSNSEDDEGANRKQNMTKLDNPFRTFGDVNVAKEDSVFRNPFRDKEEERIAVLEHHVKMTQNPETALTINGKKICWNYRKRKCYLGTQCPYAHDSDVPLTEEQLKEQKIENDLHRVTQINQSSVGIGIKPNKTNLPGTAAVVAGGYDSSAFYSSPHLGGNNKDHGLDDEEPSSSSTRKRVRVGLKNGLVPPKKALQLYNTTKDKKC